MTETTTQVERVARAIYEEDDPWHKAWPWPDLNENQGSPDQYRRIATAAIKAMSDAEPVALREALGTIMDRMEALEDEASDALTTELSVQAAGFMRGQKSTAKSLRSHLHDMTRQSLVHAAPQTHTAPIPREVAPQGRDEVERLREALRAFVDGATHTMVFLTSREKMHSCGVDLYREDVERARAALSSPLS